MSVPSFSVDMLPRHFPKSKGQLEQKSVAPMPTLPGLSLLLDDENKTHKLEAVTTTEQKKTFEQWKHQNEAKFIDKSTAPERKFEKKQVRFETDYRANGHYNEKAPNQQVSPSLSPNLELSYNEAPFSHGEDNVHRQQRRQNQHQNQHYTQHNSQQTGRCEVFEKTVIHSRFNSKSTSSSPIINHEACDAVIEHQAKLNFQQNNRFAHSNSLKANCFLTKHDGHHQDRNRLHTNQHCCQINQNRCEIRDNPSINNHHIYTQGMQSNGGVNGQQKNLFQQQEIITGQQLMNPFIHNPTKTLKRKR